MKKSFKTVVFAFICCLSLCGAWGLNGKVEANGTISAESIEKAISFAYNIKDTNPTKFQGKCAAFVWQCYNYGAGIGNPSFATARQMGDALITNTDTNPPRGALVFWYDSNGPATLAGHVGLSIGNGQVIHAYTNVVISNISTVNKSHYIYRGWGAPIAGWTLATAQTEAPQNVQTKTDASNVTVTWNASSGATSYKVYIVESPWGWENIIASAETTGTSYAFTINKTGYFNAFVIASCNGIDSSQSNWSSFYILGEPYNTWTAVSGSTVEIRWNGPDNASSYDVYVLSAPYNWENTVCKTNTTDGMCSFTITESGEYVAFVIARNGNCYSKYGNWSYFKINASPPSAPVINGEYPAYYSVGNTVSVQWNTVDNAQYYNYYLSREPSGYAYESNDSSGSTTETFVSFDNLEAGEYMLFVQAINDFGWSDQSKWIKIVIEYDDYIPTKTTVWNNHLYALYDYKLEWTAVYNLCKKMNGHIVTITSAEENAVVHELTRQGKYNYYWIGGRAEDPYTDNYNLVWCNNEKFEYTNWESGEPNHLGNHRTKEGFLQINSANGQWNDVPNVFEASIGFIIEYDLEDIQYAKELTYNGKSYLRYDIAMPWTDAQEFCKYLGGNLVIYDSDDEYENVKELLYDASKYWYYVGGYKNNGKWQWCDGNEVEFSDKIKLWDVYYDKFGNYLMEYAQGEDDAIYKMVGIRNVYHPSNHHAANIGFICEKENKTPITQSSVRMVDNVYSVTTNFINVNIGKVIIAGYKENKMIDLEIKDYSENVQPVILTGDLDLVKVMVWDDMDSMKPITNIEEIPESKWLAE